MLLHDTSLDILDRILRTREKLKWLEFSMFTNQYDNGLNFGCMKKKADSISCIIEGDRTPPKRQKTVPVN
jgi:hypothetical protein